MRSLGKPLLLSCLLFTFFVQGDKGFNANRGTSSVSNRIFYIDYDNGSDKHSGIAKEAAWKRCPGMTGCP